MNLAEAALPNRGRCRLGGYRTPRWAGVRGVMVKVEN